MMKRNESMTVVFPDGKKETKETVVITEHVLDVMINEKPYYRLVCTKSDLKELVTGRLCTDGLIEKAGDINRIIICKNDSEADLSVDKDILEEDAKMALKKLPGYEWKSEWVFSLANEFKKGSKLHDLTGGSHVCILAKNGKPAYICEDIGRHNAVDKAVGYALINGIPLSECMLFISGRVPTDMVEKVIRARIPVLVSKSVPTAESVELAKEYDLTLICRAWPDRFEIFGEA